MVLLVLCKVELKRRATGTLLALPVHSVHMDDEVYSNAQDFDGFRFSKLREIEGGGVTPASFIPGVLS